MTDGRVIRKRAACIGDDYSERTLNLISEVRACDSTHIRDNVIIVSKQC